MKRLRRVIAVMSLAIMPTGVIAQGHTESFEQFRKSMLADYNDYRYDAISRYAMYLDSLWVAYSQCPGIERNPAPKPTDIPTVGENKPKPQRNVPPTSDNNPGVGGPTTTSPINRPNIPVSHESEGEISILFYGMQLTMEDVDYTIPDCLSPKNSSTLWRYMYDTGADKSVITAIRKIADKMNLNDYLIYELTRKYVDTKFANHTPFSKDALIHFLLCNMGYDVRLAQTESGSSLILMPCNQTIFEHTHIVIGGKKYYAFSDSQLRGGEAIYSCYLPDDMPLGKAFEMRLKDLRLPYNPYKFCIDYDGITLSGEVNANIYPILYRYPQMGIADYVESVIDSELRKSIVAQLSDALKNNSQRDKVERLLSFTQNAFEYATDAMNHGFEKPYFFEEMFYYKRNDCEDRSIFYSYLLYHMVGVENHIISFQGHECVSLSMPSEKLNGTSYTYDGKQFFISDPTYIGAATGMCMPRYQTEKPTIDYIYK